MLFLLINFLVLADSLVILGVAVWFKVIGAQFNYLVGVAASVTNLGI